RRTAARIRATQGVCPVSVSPAGIGRELENVARLLFPSRDERFGIAALEALAAGVPVVCSDLPALREVVGGAALFVSSSDTTAWIDATRRLLRDPALRRGLSERGRIRAARFTWRTAIDTLETHAPQLLSNH